MGVIARKPKLVHPLLGYICGMCSDELPYGQIADKVLEAKGYAHDLEAQLAGAVDALRELRGRREVVESRRFARYAHPAMTKARQRSTTSRGAVDGRPGAPSTRSPPG
jgi:hypothetical protein